MTGDRSTLLTPPEVQALLDNARVTWFLYSALAVILAAVSGFTAGALFAANLYGGG